MSFSIPQQLVSVIWDGVGCDVYIHYTGADVGTLRGGVGGSGPEFFKGGLGSRSAGIFIY